MIEVLCKSILHTQIMHDTYSDNYWYTQVRNRLFIMFDDEMPFDIYGDDQSDEDQPIMDEFGNLIENDELDEEDDTDMDTDELALSSDDEDEE